MQRALVEPVINTCGAEKESRAEGRHKLRAPEAHMISAVQSHADCRLLKYEVVQEAAPEMEGAAPCHR